VEYLILFITILITSQWVPIRNNILSVFGQKTPYTVEKNKAFLRRSSIFRKNQKRTRRNTEKKT